MTNQPRAGKVKFAFKLWVMFVNQHNYSSVGYVCTYYLQLSVKPPSVQCPYRLSIYICVPLKPPSVQCPYRLSIYICVPLKPPSVQCPYRLSIYVCVPLKPPSVQCPYRLSIYICVPLKPPSVQCPYRLSISFLFFQPKWMYWRNTEVFLLLLKWSTASCSAQNLIFSVTDIIVWV
jgi:hypothetical protein